MTPDPATLAAGLRAVRDAAPPKPRLRVAAARDGTFHAVYGDAPARLWRLCRGVRKPACFTDLFAPPAVRPSWTCAAWSASSPARRSAPPALQRMRVHLLPSPCSRSGRRMAKSRLPEDWRTRCRKPGSGAARARRPECPSRPALPTLARLYRTESERRRPATRPFAYGPGGGALPVPQRVGEIQAMLETVIEMVREVSRELNPAVAERVGLRAALDRLAGRLRADFKGNVRVFADATAQPAPEAAGALYRIAEEAAGHAARRTGCSAIEILLKSLRSGPALEIRDNGPLGSMVDGSYGGSYEGGLEFVVMRHFADRAGIELQIDSAHRTGEP
jgi:hypothetical protein